MPKLKDAGSKLSPGWKNPRDIMRRTLRKKGISSQLAIGPGRRQLSLDESHPTTSCSQPAFSSDSDGRGSRNRGKNPFKKSPKKKNGRLSRKCSTGSLNSENFVPEPEAESNLYSALEHQERDSVSLAGFPTDFSHLLRQEIVEPPRLGRHASSTSELSALAAQNVLESTLAFQRKHSSPKIPNAGLRVPKESERPPLDMRLSTRLRVSSTEPFPWMDLKGKQGPLTFKAQEKALGLKLFLQEKDSGFQSADESCNLDPTSLSKAGLYASTLYYSHPDLPWLNMFPRLETGKKQVATSVNSLGHKIQSAISAAWCKSFENLYQSLKAGLCPSFYVCCPTLTVVFLNTKTDTSQDMDTSRRSTSSLTGGGDRDDGLRAIISITSSPIRQALREEGIKFLLPYRSGSRRGSTETVGSASGGGDSSSGSGRSLMEQSSVTQSQPPFFSLLPDKSPITSSLSCGDFPDRSVAEKCGEEEEEEGLDSSGGSEDQEAWMKDIGISPGQAQKFNRRISSDKLTQPTNSGKDERLKSVGLVMGTLDVHCLYNFIVNSPLCRAPAGPQAGLPPTLLSRNPFLGGTLKNLTVKCVSQRRDNQDTYMMDVTGGPVLPGVSHLICEELQSAESNRFSLSCGGKEGYLGMNVVSGNGTESLDVQESQVFQGAEVADFEDLKFEFGKYRF